MGRINFIQEKEKEKLKNLMVGTQKLILRIKSAIPFELFPDEISIDINKVNFVFRHFMAGEQSHSFDLDEIVGVEADTAPFFASLNFTFKSTQNPPITIKFLKKKEAVLMRRLIDGLKIAKKNNIDLSKLDNETIVNQISQLGKIKETDY